MNIWEEIQVNFQNMVQDFTGYIPNIIHAIMVLLGGWLIARLIQWIMLRLSHSLGIDRLAQKSGVHKFLEKRGVKNGFSGILSRICFWATMLLVMVSFFNSLGLEIVSDLLNQLILFIPNVLIASILVIIGFYLAEFVSSLVVSNLEENSFDNPELIGKLAESRTATTSTPPHQINSIDFFFVDFGL